MLFLLLTYFLTQSNLGGDASPIPLIEPRADVSCNDLNQCRTIWNIVWSCLSTVLLCTWVTLHPNIAIAPDTDGLNWFEGKLWHPLRAFLKNKLLLFLWALIAPEYILAWAIRQYLKVGEIQRKCNTRQTNANENPVPFREWKRTHGFFLVMGGFHLYSLPDGATSVAYQPELSISSNFVLPLPGHSREGAKAEHPLDFEDFSAHELAYFAPNEKEIKDKGKADIIAKILALLQTSWFIAQCIARGVEDLPLTELEVPKDVGYPIRVYKASEAERVRSGEKRDWESGVRGISERIYTYVVGWQDEFFRLSEESQVPMFWSGNSGISNETRAMFGASILGIAFGSIHFIAWNSAFPSHVELLLWRISCVAITAVPLTLTIFCGSLVMGSKMSGDTWPKNILYLALILAVVPLPVSALLYFFARIATLVMAFTTLRTLPSDAFKTVNWATFIPHL